MKQHWSPHYIYNRISEALYHRRNPETPWLNRAAIEVFDTLLKSSDHMVEFGAGRSTFWFSSRVERLISVEHQKAWAEDVQSKLKAKNINNVELKFFPTEYKDETTGTMQSDYVIWLDTLENLSIDVALIDGTYRGAAATKVLPKLKCGGLLVIDNVNWYLPSESKTPASRSGIEGPLNPIWEEVLHCISGWRHLWLSDGVTDTAFFFKPCL